MWLPDCSKLAINWKTDNDVIIFQHDVIVKLFWRCFISLVKFSYLSNFHVNIITGSGIMPIFFYKGLTRNPEIRNTLRIQQLPENHHTWSCTCANILAYVTYVGKYEKVYIKHYNFYLVIFLIIFPQLVLIYIEWKIVYSAKNHIEVSFTKNPCHNLKNI